MKIELKVPSIATIGVSGPVQCGKSIVLSRLANLLQEEFGATVVMNEELKHDYRPPDSEIAGWERDLVKRTVWVLAE